MVVRHIRKKEMNFENQVPSSGMPATDAPEIPDHTHSEMDQVLIKIQELEDMINSMGTGTPEMGEPDMMAMERLKKKVRESLEEGKPEDDKGKPTGDQIDPTNVTQESMVRSIVGKVMEELKGIPERDIGKQLDTAGPDNTDSVPLTVQPPVGTAPSGGEFDSKDKLNDADGDVVVGKTKKPVSDYDKLPIVKNKMARAKSLIERAKRLMTESNEPDPSAPNPGATEKDPKKMDAQTPNKSPAGGTEAMDTDEDDEDEKDKPEAMVEKVIKGLRKEMYAERRSIVAGAQGSNLAGKSNLSTEASGVRHESYMSAKQGTMDTIKEYLGRV